MTCFYVRYGMRIVKVTIEPKHRTRIASFSFYFPAVCIKTRYFTCICIAKFKLNLLGTYLSEFYKICDLETLADLRVDTD